MILFVSYELDMWTKQKRKKISNKVIGIEFFVMPLNIIKKKYKKSNSKNIGDTFKPPYKLRIKKYNGL